MSPSSNPKSKGVIPTPLSVRWREFRLSTLPGVVVLVTLASAIFLWKGFMVPATVVGRVETIQANVVSTKPGALTQLSAFRFQPVNAGDPIAIIITTDPRLTDANLAVIKAEVELLRAGITPMDNLQRNAINYEQLRLDLMQQKVDLAGTRIKLQLSEAEFNRMDSLFADRLVSQSDYDSAKSARDEYRTQVEEQTQLVTDIEASIKRIQGNTPVASDSQSQLRAALSVQERKITLVEAESQPLVLTAPIDGLISLIHRRNGENIAAGEPIVTISASHTDHIVGYLRQPLTIQPQTNMTVRVRSRGPNRAIGHGRIVSVGAHLQPINDALLPPTRPDVESLGLPFLVSLPPGLAVHPGELVDLTILR
jgi:HlyD family secretion protein